MTDTPKTLDFEASLAELEALVERMESGELTLEASLEAFERGIRLTRDCQSALKQAELRVKALIDGADGPSLADLEVDDDD